MVLLESMLTSNKAAAAGVRISSYSKLLIDDVSRGSVQTIFPGYYFSGTNRQMTQIPYFRYSKHNCVI
jgi:hypothetical protein